MEPTDELLVLARTLAAHRGISLARLATIVANDGRFFTQIETGRSPTIRTYRKASGWFSEHWPEDLVWPDGVPRLAVTTPRSGESA